MTRKSTKSLVVLSSVPAILGLMAERCQAQGSSALPSDDVAAHDGRHEFLVPECFELANIVLVLTAWGADDKAGNFFVDTPYHNAVSEHFGPNRDHPLFAALARMDFDSFNDFVGFRENSFAYAFEGRRLVRTAPFSSWWNPQNLPDHFTANLALLEDFAEKSRFREFYRRHAELYERERAELGEMVDLEGLHAWLEARFPVRFNATRDLFSPLLRGNHSSSIKRSDNFAMIWIAVAGPRLARVKSVAGGDITGLRQIFTEIDHGYVDPVSVSHMERIREALSETKTWYANPGGFYASPFASFNEYMTWGVMLLYVRDSYPRVRYQLAREEVIEYMVRNRRFVAFEEFFAALVRLYDARSQGQTIADLYPSILDWAKRHNEAGG